MFQETLWGSPEGQGQRVLTQVALGAEWEQVPPALSGTSGATTCLITANSPRWSNRATMGTLFHGIDGVYLFGLSFVTATSALC